MARELTASALHVVREVDRLLSLGLSFDEVPIGFEALKIHGTTFPDPRAFGDRVAAILGGLK